MHRWRGDDSCAKKNLLFNYFSSHRISLDIMTCTVTEPQKRMYLQCIYNIFIMYL